MPGWGPFDMSGKSLVVTGAAVGIGRGIAGRFVEAGANVIVGDLDAEAASLATWPARRSSWTVR